MEITILVFKAILCYDKDTKILIVSGNVTKVRVVHRKTLYFVGPYLANTKYRVLRYTTLTFATFFLFRCRIQDDVQDIAAEILSADLILLATPIYSWYCTPPMKALLDRLVYGLNKYYGEEKADRVREFAKKLCSI